MAWTPEQQTRLNREWGILQTYFPRFEFKTAASLVYLDGLMQTNSKNWYSVRLYVPADMPNSVPEVVITYPNPLKDYYGKHITDYLHSAVMHLLSPRDGFPKVCTYKSTYWNPNRTFYNVLIKVRIWLEALEGHQVTGKPLDHFLKHQV